MPSEVGIQKKGANFLKNMALKIKESHGGKVPCKGSSLEELPGVARKARVVIRNEAFGFWDGIGGDVHVAELTEAFGHFNWEGSPSKKAEHAEAALHEWVKQLMGRDMNKVFSSFAQLLTQAVSVVETVDNKLAMCRLSNAAGEYLHKPYHVELLWFMFRAAPQHYRNRRQEG